MEGIRFHGKRVKRLLVHSLWFAELPQVSQGEYPWLTGDFIITPLSTNIRRTNNGKGIKCRCVVMEARTYNLFVYEYIYNREPGFLYLRGYLRRVNIYWFD
jgi:hypothetical protein